MRKRLLTLLSLACTLGMSAQTPYEFNASDYFAHDTGRADKVEVIEGTNTFEVYGKEGNMNVAFDLNFSDENINGKYYITPEQCWYVVEGTGLKADKSDTYCRLWYSLGWFNGTPTYVMEKDGKQYFAWNISSRISSTDNTTLSKRDNYINCTSLSSTREDHHGIISNVAYMTEAEVKVLFDIPSPKARLSTKWAQLTSLSAGFDYSDKFFALFDHSKDLAIMATYHTSDGDAHWGNVYSMNYSTSTLADSNPAAVWAIDAFDGEGDELTAENTAGNFMLTNLQDMNRHFRTEGWNHGLWQTYMDRKVNDGDKDRKRVMLQPFYVDGSWYMQNRETGGYMGPWGQNFSDGVVFTANESFDNRTNLDIYYMTRSAWMQQAYDWAEESAQGAFDITKMLTNPSFERINENSHPIGWEVTGDGVVENGYMSGCDGGIYMNNWQGSGQLSDRSISQVVKGLPAGKYRLTVLRMCNGQGAYLFANSKSAEISNDGDNVGDFSMDFTLTEASTDVTLGVKLEGFTANNIKYDNIRLYYLGTSSAKVGTATVSGSMTPGSTITFSYDGAFTDSEEALALAQGNVTLNGTSVDVTLTANGFTIQVPADVTAATQYTISVPAGFIGYAQAGVYNDAQELTLTSPVIFDGIYYLKSLAPEKADHPYLGRGVPYGTSGYLKEYGAPIKIVNSDKGTQLIFADANTQFKENGYMYTDGEGSGYDRYWTVSKTADGKYMFLNNNNNMYLSDWYDRIVGDGPSDRTTSYWTIETPDEYIASIKANDAAKLVAVAEAAGIEAESVAEVEAELKTRTSEAIELNDADTFIKSYQQNCSGDWNADPYNVVSYTLSGLNSGLYKLTLNAFERATLFDEVAAAGQNGMRGDCYLQAGDVKVNIIGLMEEPSDEALDGENDSQANNKFYANTDEGAQAAFDAGMYLNTLYVNVGESGELTYKLVIPSRYGTDGSRQRLICAQNFTLTYYPEASATMAISADAQYGTFCAPFDVTVPEGVTASIAELNKDGETIDLYELEDETLIPAHTPVIVYAEAGLEKTTFYGKATEGTPEQGCLVGTYERIYAPVGSYILQKKNDKVAFYLCDEKTNIVAQNRCYLVVPEGTSVKAIRFAGEETAISQMAADQRTKVIYDLTGRKVSKAQKGIYIENGKKMFINK